jgi:predicted CoA-substrate-specific enzyme activase
MHDSNDYSTLDLGLDVGSVSAKAVVIDREGNILRDVYRRIHGRPVETTIAVLDELIEEYGLERLGQISLTGTGGKLLAKELGALFVNEIVAQARAEAEFYPHVRTIIEIGGEDSKLIQLKEENGRVVIDDFAMNSICAAGTGSFLDQQAKRLGVNIEDEFGRLAMKSVRPPRIAGRCTVFAKSDMIHLQQKATPDYDIIAGLCFALARNFKANLGRGREFEKPVAFQGGVAANQGVVRAFTEILGIEPGELVIPEHFTSMGAIGGVLNRRDSSSNSPFRGTDALKAFLNRKPPSQRRLPQLPRWTRDAHATLVRESDGEILHRDRTRMDVYLGVDVGSISTKVVAIDRNRNVIAKAYLMTAGRPIEAVQEGLRIVGGRIADFVTVRGVGSTGSGRYLTGDFVGADVIRNEITAQAIAASCIDPRVDTIFEIGGQDSKYISIDSGVVVDFQMNHVCAAGTGSFLEEQAEKLGIRIEEEFGRLAMECETPVRLGERCTVFMESDLVLHQQTGARTDELVLLHRPELPEQGRRDPSRRDTHLLPGRDGVQRRRGECLPRRHGQGDHRATRPRGDRRHRRGDPHDGIPRGQGAGPYQHLPRVRPLTPQLRLEPVPVRRLSEHLRDQRGGHRRRGPALLRQPLRQVQPAEKTQETPAGKGPLQKA